MGDLNKVDENYNLEILTEEMLEDARKSINLKNTLSLPIEELSMLGASISSLVPAFNTITQTTSLPTDGLYKIANAALGDTLKMAKNGNAWGAMKTTKGKSKMVQLKEVGSLTVTTKTMLPIDPATIFVAMMLYSIEKDIKEISETQKKILSFLEVENESQIEADVETLMEIVNNYKYNWDKELVVANSHNVIMDIKNRSRKNILAFQKKLTAEVSKKQLLTSQGKINSTLADLLKKFKYYRLSIYIFSLASLMEIMLSGNFKEEYIENTKNEIEKLSAKYRDYFNEASLDIEKISKSGVEANLFKGIGLAGKTAGKFIGNIPLIKKGPVDEFLKAKGENLYNDAQEIEKNLVRKFAELANPGTRVLIKKIEDLNYIYNRTNQVCFNKDSIYFLS
ncbi:hypothetical protein [Anaerococcus sp. Marseille-P3625]|uniref:hypothetical protein n=1 Tax=Anaerococcus sp. Marseille-P3625 TaxID=1977277 RepID=UPI0015DD963C|nr:hypothetical protein [Anaerococcus sp. Marseille-P3625]